VYVQQSQKGERAPKSRDLSGKLEQLSPRNSFDPRVHREAVVASVDDEQLAH